MKTCTERVEVRGVVQADGRATLHPFPGALGKLAGGLLVYADVMQRNMH